MINWNSAGLFDSSSEFVPQSINVSEITGLQYLPDFIDQATHDELLSVLDTQPWLADLKRRVQHYGYKYDYAARRINYSMRLGPLPDWALGLADKLVERKLMPEMPDQLIVNEYLPGQGIANHIDCVPCFTETIASLSLGSSCVMNFTNKQSQQVIPVLLDTKSLVILQGDARYAWTHGISSRKTDAFMGRTIQRRRRVSLTFRKVILEDS